MTAWDFAAGLYERPGVETICLRLQDAGGQCVPLLLWRLWSAYEARAVDAEVLGRAVEVARTWESLVVAPLREVRRRLKTPLPTVADAARALLRDEVAAAELTGERVLLDALAALTPGPGGARIGAMEALHGVSTQWGGAPSWDDLSQLALAATAYDGIGEGLLAQPHRSATNPGAPACG